MNIINYIKKIVKTEDGNVILWTMMFMALFFLIISTVATITISEIRQSTSINSSTEAYFLAEAGAERAKNYAYGDEDGGKETSGLIRGYIGGSTNFYDFKVVRASAGLSVPNYDGNRSCSNVSGATDKYCYYSQSTIGKIRRKIDGERKEIPLSQGKTIDLHSTTGFSPTYGITGLLNMTPDSGTSPKTFTYGVTIEKITSASGNTSITGIVDTGGVANKKAIRIYRGQSSIALGIGYINSTGGGSYTNYSAASNISQTIPTSVNDIRATLTYRKGAPDQKQNIITLRLVDVDTERCLGVITMSNITEMQTLGDISPYYAFFSGGNVTINNTMGKIRADRNASSSEYYYYKNLFLGVE